jgi:hypothetical protein
MAIPSRRRGFRSLEHDGVTYRWRMQAGIDDSRIVLYGESSSSARLEIQLRGWRNEWVGFPELVDNEPRMIGRAFVLAALQAALAFGYRPSPRGRPFVIVYHEGRFLRRGGGTH